LDLGLGSRDSVSLSDQLIFDIGPGFFRLLALGDLGVESI
jgi:hypothetical protein